MWEVKSASGQSEDGDLVDEHLGVDVFSVAFDGEGEGVWEVVLLDEVDGEADESAVGVDEGEFDFDFAPFGVGFVGRADEGAVADGVGQDGPEAVHVEGLYIAAGVGEAGGCDVSHDFMVTSGEDGDSALFEAVAEVAAVEFEGEAGCGVAAVFVEAAFDEVGEADLLDLVPAGWGGAVVSEGSFVEVEGFDDASFEDGGVRGGAAGGGGLLGAADDGRGQHGRDGEDRDYRSHGDSIGRGGGVA